MRFTLSLFAFLAVVPATFASLLARQNFPTCSYQCLATTSTGPCSSTDAACLCKDQTFMNSTTTCMRSSCIGTDLQAANAAAEALCLVVGVTLTPSLGTATTTATASATSPTSDLNSGSVTISISVFAGTVAALAMVAVL